MEGLIGGRSKHCCSVDAHSHTHTHTHVRAQTEADTLVMLHRFRRRLAVFEGRFNHGDMAAAARRRRRRRLDSSFHSSLSYSREGDISRASARLFAKAGSNLSASGPRHSASCPAPLRFISHLAAIFQFCFRSFIFPSLPLPSSVLEPRQPVLTPRSRPTFFKICNLHLFTSSPPIPPSLLSYLSTVSQST